jgi:hypothetical protein
MIGYQGRPKPILAKFYKSFHVKFKIRRNQIYRIELQKNGTANSMAYMTFSLE